MVALPKFQPVAHMTVIEFLAWPADPTGRTWQLIDGEPVAMAPASRTHGAVQSEVARLLGNHLRERGSPCLVITAPGVVPRVRADWNVRVPDLAVTCSPDDPAERLLADPVLIVEILSPSNEAETWANVWAYTTIPSVREILVLRSLERAGELLRRSADGTWPQRGITLGPGDEVALESVVGSFHLAAFYATTRVAPAP
ncbi:MAG TPA: Uma2 family endonuclease [Acetobacteraceae bacterium]|nr:Uma2 family endonuclease [Acetobacteraceae bacterium]